MQSGKPSRNNKIQNPLNYALRLLGFRSYTEFEIKEKLLEKGFSKKDSDIVIKKLKKYQLIDDRQFVINWIKNRDTLRPRSRYVLIQELNSKGINRELAEKVFYRYEKENDGFSDLNRAQALVSSYRKKSIWQKKDQTDKKKSLLALLARKGFNYEISLKAIKEME